MLPIGTPMVNPAAAFENRPFISASHDVPIDPLNDEGIDGVIPGTASVRSFCEPLRPRAV